METGNDGEYEYIGATEMQQDTYRKVRDEDRVQVQL